MKLTTEQKDRFWSSLKKTGIFLTVGFVYYLFVRLTGWKIPCLLTLFTGGLCPGCGITRMFLALGDLDFARAFRCNMLVMSLMPFALFFGLRRWLRYVKTGEDRGDKPETVFVLIAAVLTILFWILRNLPSFSFLAPI